MILDKQAYVSRLTADDTDSDKEQYATVDGLGNIPINIQPASDEVIAVTEGAYGQTYVGYTSISGIQVGDQITVSGTGVNYVVKGLRDWYFPPLPHVELLLFARD